MRDEIEELGILKDSTNYVKIKDMKKEEAIRFAKWLKSSGNKKERDTSTEELYELFITERRRWIWERNN